MHWVVKLRRKHQKRYYFLALREGNLYLNYLKVFAALFKSEEDAEEAIRSIEEAYPKEFEFKLFCLE